MDYPFEYVERVWNYPNLDTRSHFDIEKYRECPKECPESEECEDDEKRPELILKEEEVKPILKRMEELRREVKNSVDGEKLNNIRGLNCPVVGEWFDLEEEQWTMDDENLSVDETSSDGLDELAEKGMKPAPRMNVFLKRMKVMQHCACTDSACDSASPAPKEVSSDTTSSESCEGFLDDGSPEAIMAKEIAMSRDKALLSSETSESSDDEYWGLDEEIKFLEQVLEQKLLEEKNGSPSKEVGDLKPSPTDQAPDDTEKEIAKAVAVIAKKQLKSAEEMFLESTSTPETTSSDTSSSSTSEAPSHVTFEFSTDSLFNEDSNCSSAVDLDNMQKMNIEKFCWDSEDLNAPSATDSEMEKDVKLLESSWKTNKKMFEKTVVPNVSTFEDTKMKNFAKLLPEKLATTRSYTLLEEPTTDKLGVIQKRTWLALNDNTGRMCSVKFASIKDRAEMEWQTVLLKEAKVLYELMPELSGQTHIARLLDVGLCAEFKFLIFEDLGTDLNHLSREFKSKFDFATKFLISYFTMSAIKELHYFGFLHLDIRPSSFSVIHAPFNIKIKSYGKATRKTKNMRAPSSLRPDSFSPRIFHKKGKTIDEYCDIESWIYTMMCLYGNSGLPWFGKKESMHGGKEYLFNAARTFSTEMFKGCTESVFFAAHLLAGKKMQYKDFWKQMDKMNSVEVMQFSDWTQPLLWRSHELTKVKKHYAPNPELYWDQAHWNPADEFDSDDEKCYERVEGDWENRFSQIRQDIRSNTTWRRERWEERHDNKEDELESDKQSISPIKSPKKNDKANRKEEEKEKEEMTRLEEEMKTCKEKAKANEELSQSPASNSPMSDQNDQNDDPPNSLMEPKTLPGFSPKPYVPSAPSEERSVSQYGDGSASESSSFTSADSWASTWTSSSGSCSDALLLWGNEELPGPLPEVEDKLDDFERIDFEAYQHLIVGAQEEGGSSDSDSVEELDPDRILLSSEDERERQKNERLLVNLVLWKNRFHQENYNRPRPVFNLKEPVKGALKKH